jgi:hypothetical protein
MKELRFTLIADGSSDAALLHIIKWSLDDLYPNIINSLTFADFRTLPDPPKTINEKIKIAKSYYPFDILLIHRDAESTDPKLIKTRSDEVSKSLCDDDHLRTVCIVPIKMMETWLLIDKDALKQAAANRKYDKLINLPKINALEKEAQPKKLLFELLKTISELKGRRLNKFNVESAVHQVAENISDFSPLRNLVGFRAFEVDLKRVMDAFTKTSK